MMPYSGCCFLVVCSVDFDGDVTSCYLSFSTNFFNHIAALVLYILQLFLPVGHLET